MELRVGDEKKHTCFAYIAKSKTGPNRENKSYNQIKMCMCVVFWMELALLYAWLFLLFWDMSYLPFSFPLFLLFLFFMLLSTDILFSLPPFFIAHIFLHDEYEESCQRDGVFLGGREACPCVTSNAEVSMYIWSVLDLNLKSMKRVAYVKVFQRYEHMTLVGIYHIIEELSHFLFTK